MDSFMKDTTVTTSERHYPIFYVNEPELQHVNEPELQDLGWIA